MKWGACVVALLLLWTTGQAQEKDRKVIFELKTKCMELAKDLDLAPCVRQSF